MVMHAYNLNLSFDTGLASENKTTVKIQIYVQQSIY